MYKGSDASNVHDEEVNEDELEFSDDEAEQAFKRQRKRFVFYVTTSLERNVNQSPATIVVGPPPWLPLDFRPLFRRICETKNSWKKMYMMPLLTTNTVLTTWTPKQGRRVQLLYLTMIPTRRLLDLHLLHHP